MVHVHQFFEFLTMADRALQSTVAFVEDAQNRHRHRHRQQDRSRAKRRARTTEWVVVDTDGSEKEGHDDDSTPIADLETYWRPDTIVC